MPANTSRLGLTYQLSSEPPNGASLGQTLATQLDGLVNGYYKGTAANRSTVVATPTDGVIYHATDTDQWTMYDGAAWRPLGPAVVLSLLTAAGDLIYATGAGAAARLGVGTPGQVLGVSGGVPAWVAAPAGASARLYQTTAQGNLTSGSAVQVLLDTEDYSVGSITPSTSGYSITIAVAGTYIVAGKVGINSAAVTAAVVYIYKNGVTVTASNAPANSSQGPIIGVSDLLRLAVGDVLTLYVQQNSGSTIGSEAGTATTSLAATLVSL